MPLTGGPGRVREAPMQMDLCGGMLPPETEKNIRADLVLCSLYLSDLSSACDLGSLNLTDSESPAGCSFFGLEENAHVMTYLSLMGFRIIAEGISLQACLQG